MGLATVSIQTAAGSANPEVTIDGVLEAEALRDFLYTKMRGVRDHAPAAPPRRTPRAAADAGGATATRRSRCSPRSATRLRRLEARLGGPGASA